MIRPAKETEYHKLTTISFASKEYWNYPDEYFTIWNNELTIKQEYIQNNNVFVYERNGEIIGYYSVIELKKEIVTSGIKLDKGFWLEHMFILPLYIGQGIGRKMFSHLKQWCQQEGISKLCILADPNAQGFYEKMGCEYQKEYPSTIPNRTTPLLVFRGDSNNQHSDIKV